MISGSREVESQRENDTRKGAHGRFGLRTFIPVDIEVFTTHTWSHNKQLECNENEKASPYCSLWTIALRVEKILALSNAMERHGSFASQSFRARVAENDELRVRDFTSLIAK